MAVMSMMGFVIGLGDRHLDNVLLDLSTGQVRATSQYFLYPFVSLQRNDCVCSLLYLGHPH